MASIPLPVRSDVSENLRPLNILRDLPRVADLIELCFANSMDSEGKSYIRQMRHASHDVSFLRWASNAIESTSLPLSGFVWEQDGKIIGNTSLVPFRYKDKRIHLIANVATHPDHRRKGIARALTERAMQHARQRGTDELWLHVRTDNPGAVQMYKDLGFSERAWRTTWRMKKDVSFYSMPSPTSGSTHDLQTVTKRYARFWPQQHAWLNQLHPEELSWYRSLNWNNLKPGLWNLFYRAFVEFDLRQWAVQSNGQLEGVLVWIPTLRISPLWLACNPDARSETIYALLRKAHRELGIRQNMTLEHPAGLQEEALSAAGFYNARTLIWMHKEIATS